MKKIIYISDYSENTDIAETEYKVVENVYSEDYVTEHLQLDFLNPDNAVKQIEKKLSEYDGEEILIAKGVGCFFAVYFGGGRVKVCISPRLRNFYFPEGVEVKYNSLRNSLKKNFTHFRRCNAAICSTDEPEYDSFLYVTFHKNIYFSNGVDITPHLLNDKVTPLFDKLDRYEWYDECGVHYTKWGCCIDDVNHWVFDKFEKYTIPDSVQSIKSEVFGMSQLKKITIGSCVQEIPSQCFSDCWYLKEVVMNSPGLWKIGEYAFSGCRSLEEIDLHQTHIKVISENAFADTRLQFIELPDRITHCPQSALPDGCMVIISRQKYDALLKSDLELQHMDDELFNDYDFDIDEEGTAPDAELPTSSIEEREVITENDSFVTKDNAG